MELILRDYQDNSLKQLTKSYKSGKGKRKIVVLPCGAGKTAVFAYMAMNSQKKGKIVWFLVHRKELLDQTIETFKRFDIPIITVLIGMVGSVANKIDKYPTPDFIIFDECHFSAAATWKKIIDKYPDVYYVGLTATPCRLDGKPLGDIYDELIIGITAKELIQRGYLADYDYWSRPLIDTDNLKTKRGDYDSHEIAEIIEKAHIYGDVVDNYIKIANGKKTICYCDCIVNSKAVADKFQQSGINAVHFDGTTPPAERKRIVQDFRNGKITVLCNVDLISVGFDVPDCECCILLRPTQSTALYIQQAMRALRPLGEKRAIIIDHVDNIKRHGFPDDDREWSLEVKQKKPKPAPIKTCGKCFLCCNASCKICPNCGEEFPIKEKVAEEKTEVDGELILIDKEKYRSMKFKDYKQLKTYAELKEFAKARGYKNGFAYIKAKEMGILR